MASKLRLTVSQKRSEEVIRVLFFFGDKNTPGSPWFIAFFSIKNALSPT